MIEIAIRAFVGTLNAGWSSVRKLEDESKLHGTVSDWAQASWEVLVESSLQQDRVKVRLVVYGDGADCHGASSRFSFPEDRETHEVRCTPIHDMVVDRITGNPVSRNGASYALGRFVSVADGWYFERPAFDHALIERDGKEFVVSIEQLQWQLVEL